MIGIEFITFCYKRGIFTWPNANVLRRGLQKSEFCLDNVSYLQSEDRNSLVKLSLLMSIDLHCNGKTNFYHMTRTALRVLSLQTIDKSPV